MPQFYSSNIFPYNDMPRLRLILSLVALMTAAPVTSVFANADSPNVIFFAFDDLNDWINPMGHAQAKTPNLDRLAAMGVTFTNAHTPATYCAPARTAIFTGRYATTTGAYRGQVYFHEHPEIVPLQQSFKNAGYATYGAGKLFHHIEGFIDLRGWDEFYMRNDALKLKGWPLNTWKEYTPLPEVMPASTYNQKKFKNDLSKVPPGLFLDYGPIPNDQEEEMADTKRINWACSIIEQDHASPFFLGVGIYAPHFPNYAPQKYYDLYLESEIILPDWKDDDLDDLPDMIRKMKTARKNGHHRLLGEWGLYQEAIHAYLACVSYADAMLGRVLDSLEASPHKDNTIVVIWSDHGYHQGQKGDWGKHTLWERTTNVPFIWAGPGFAANEQVDATVSLIDMYPTFIEACGLTPDSELEGESLVGMLRAPKTAQDRNVLVPWLEPNAFAIINQDWRYIHYQDGSEELYDVRNDPHEWYNLAQSPEFAAKKAELNAAAPSDQAPAGIDKSKLKLVFEGESFRWEPK